MGLGKTVQVICLIHMLLKQGPYGGLPILRRCLIITPGSLVQNWRREFHKWIGRENIPVFCASQDVPLKVYLSQTHSQPVIIMSYEMFLQHSDQVSAIPNIDLIICDEGHRLKNVGIKTTVALKRIRTSRRIIVTGTPIQNDLDELWSLAEFCAPGTLAPTRELFRQRIVKPLSRAHRPDILLEALTTAENEKLMEIVDEEGEQVAEAAATLSTALRKFMLRRTSDMITRTLPEKTESVVFCQPTKMQCDLGIILRRFISSQLDSSPNSDYLDSEISDFESDENSNSSPYSFVPGACILSCINAFRKLYNHPSLLFAFLTKQASEKQLNSSKRRNGSLPSTLLEQLLAAFTKITSGPSDLSLDVSGKLAVLERILKNLLSLPSVDDQPMLKGNSLGLHRLVLVSNFTQTLDFLEPICSKITMKPCLRIDSKTPIKRRMELVDRFNSKTCTERIFLLSSKAGGVGLNLFGADYLVLFDMDWNPATDAQVMARVWREGQKRPVHLYRLLTAGGLEERIFQRQIAKSLLTHRALDGGLAVFQTAGSLKSQGRLTREELRELFQSAPANSTCWTHELLLCSCQTLNSLPTTNSTSSLFPRSPSLDLSSSDTEDPDESHERVFQLGPMTSKGISDSTGSYNLHSGEQAVGLGNIKMWQHFVSKDALCSLDDPVLPVSTPSDLISAVFRLITKKATLVSSQE